MQTSHALDQALPTVTVDGFTYAVTPPDPSERHWYLIAEYLTCGNPAHRHNGPTGALRRFVVFADASGCNGVVEVDGLVVSCDLWLGEIKTRYVPKKRDNTPTWKIKRALEKARLIFGERVAAAALTDEWHARNKALYADEVQP